MASLYTDEVREERYARLRCKKNKLDKQYGILGQIAVFLAGCGLIAGGLMSFLNGIFLNPMELISFIPSAAQAVMVVLAIYKREPKFTGLMMLAFFGCDVVGALLGKVNLLFNGMFIFLVFCLILDFRWDKLRKEEGFPLFDITYEEREKRNQIREEQARNRALQAGVRTAATEQSSDMGDILDDGFDTPVLAPHLHGIHDRGQFAVGGTQRPQAYQSGEMDMLEEIGQPPSGGGSAEMDEL